jgi:hypothetical protein
VKGYGPGCHVQHAADFLHYLSFRDQLQDFALPLGQSLVQRLLPPEVISRQPALPLVF